MSSSCIGGIQKSSKLFLHAAVIPVAITLSPLVLEKMVDCIVLCIVELHGPSYSHEGTQVIYYGHVGEATRVDIDDSYRVRGLCTSWLSIAWS